MAKILEDWSNSIKDVEFRTTNYLDIYPNSGDFMYLDPPYYRTKDMYYGGIDYLDFCDWLRKQKCGYLLSFDGTVNGEELHLPEEISINEIAEFSASKLLEARQRIRELEEMQRWIPVTEKLPCGW